MKLCIYLMYTLIPLGFFFFFNDTATTEIYTLSLHDALPIYHRHGPERDAGGHGAPRLRHRRHLVQGDAAVRPDQADRKSTRLNSSHANISYAVFCLKKKNNTVQKLTDFSILP